MKVGVTRQGPKRWQAFVETGAEVLLLRESHSVAADERVRAADMLYAIGEPDVVLYFVADLAEESTDVGMLEALGKSCAVEDGTLRIEIENPEGMARAVVVVDENGKVVHTQLVEEITEEPDYDAAVAAVS